MYIIIIYPVHAINSAFSVSCYIQTVYVWCVHVLGIRTDEPALFANSWAVDLPHERACPSVDLDFNGPCPSESDMDVRPETFSLLSFAIGILYMS